MAKTSATHIIKNQLQDVFASKSFGGIGENLDGRRQKKLVDDFLEDLPSN